MELLKFGTMNYNQLKAKDLLKGLVKGESSVMIIIRRRINGKVVVFMKVEHKDKKGMKKEVVHKR